MHHGDLNHNFVFVGINGQNCRKRETQTIKISVNKDLYQMTIMPNGIVSNAVKPIVTMNAKCSILIIAIKPPYFVYFMVLSLIVLPICL